MSSMIKVALAGAGAFGLKHMDAMRTIADVEVVSLISRDLEKTREAAAKYGVAHVTTELAEARDQDGVEQKADEDCREDGAIRRFHTRHRVERALADVECAHRVRQRRRRCLLTQHAGNRVEDASRLEPCGGRPASVKWIGRHERCVPGRWRRYG